VIDEGWHVGASTGVSAPSVPVLQLTLAVDAIVDPAALMPGHLGVFDRDAVAAGPAASRIACRSPLLRPAGDRIEVEGHPPIHRRSA
jgi:hypothetical protein